MSEKHINNDSPKPRYGDHEDKPRRRDHRDTPDKAPRRDYGEKTGRPHRRDQADPADKPRRHNQKDQRGRRDYSDKPRRFSQPAVSEEFSDNPLAPSHKMQGAIDALIELDQDIMKLLVRRAKLVSRIRQGKKHAATPLAIQAEKTVRKAWEKSAPKFSRDTKFSRQLFSLLQELAILQKDEAPKDSFKLYPSQQAVSGAIPGPLSTIESQIWTALCSLSGHSFSLKDVPMNVELADTVKTFTQLGSNITWEPTGPSHGNVSFSPSGPVSLANKAIYVGDSVFTLYLTSFAAAGTTGICRLTGGSSLKSADLSPLRQVLPMLGTRLAHVIPHSNGLPANLECSGSLPSGLTLPENMPLEGVCALMIAPLIWNAPLSLNLEKLPAIVATTALALIGPIYTQLQASVETYGPKFRLVPAEHTFPQTPALSLAPAITAAMLAIPAFVGGSITLSGKWPAQMPEARMAEELLRWAGLELEIGDTLIRAQKKEGTQPGASPLPALSLPGSLSPLYYALAALDIARQSRHKKPDLLFFEDEHDESIGEEMLERAGYLFENGEIVVSALNAADKDTSSPWACPNAYWGIAYALCSFLRPGLQLANPTEVSLNVPMFWPLFNSLPALQAEGVFYVNEKDSHDTTQESRTRRRILTD